MVQLWLFSLLKGRLIWQKVKSKAVLLQLHQDGHTFKQVPILNYSPHIYTSTGNTGPNGPFITGISIPWLGLTLPSSSVAETLSPTPYLLHQPCWMVRVMTVVCLWVAQTQRASLLPPRQNSASVVGPSVHHCNICILPSMGALSSGLLETDSGCL